MSPPAGVRVLVVEDDALLQRILQKRISADGYEVIVAADGREGMRSIVAYEPDLVLSDWMMPEVDGLELCQAVKTGLGEAAPYFILLTAKGEISDKLLALQTGADDYLVKPCDHGELMARIRAGLRIVALNKELRRKVAELQRARDGRGESPAIPSYCRTCRRVELPDGSWRRLDDLPPPAGQDSGSAASCQECRSGGQTDLSQAA